MAPVQPNIHWPSGTLPLELFVSIAEHLGRKDIQALRLVNHEFNRKISGHYLRQLVIHVGSELCASLDTGASSGMNSAVLDIANCLVDSTCIFSLFGDQIFRFALALELKESELVSPNVPIDEKIFARPWGLYRWPVKPDTSKKSALEAVTESLEKSKGLFRILAHLPQVQELALSCEGGLGYLQGPNVPTYPHSPTIFGDESRASAGGACYQLDFDKPHAYERLEKMIVNAELVGPTSTLIDELLEREGATLEELSGEQRTRCPLPAREGRPELSRPLIPSQDCCQERAKTLRLQPDMLTRNQKQFLAQHITAQQALIQSYLLGVMDNASHFVNLRKLKIASLPSFHIDLLCRNDIWDKLPMLVEVSLAIVPDWRSIKHDGSQVEDAQVYPTDAIPKVFRLLNDYIGEKEHIKRIHFEWLCGGEFATGSHQRNKHVLPGPFLKNHRKIVDSRLVNLLILPHVTHLSLKNCWFTPHTFYRIIREMTLKSLVSLELTTVSLSGGPLDRPNGAGQNQAAQGNLAAQLLPTIPLSHGNEAVPPRTMSWLHFIKMSTLRQTTTEYIHEQDNAPKKLRLAGKLGLRSLKFKSCGYVEVPDGRFISSWPFEDYEEDIIEPSAYNGLGDPDDASLPFPSDVPNLGLRDRKCPCVGHFMQVNTDRHLGRVIMGIPRAEAETFKRVYGFRFGWREDRDRGGAQDAVYDKDTYDAAKRDGVLIPGRGRFTGSIEYIPVELTPLQRYEGIFYPKEPTTKHEIVRPVEILDTSRFDRDYDDENGDSLKALMLKLEKAAGYLPPPGDRETRRTHRR